MQSPRSGHTGPSRTKLAVLGLLLALPLVAYALDVDRAELEKAGNKRIVFINYEGPHAKIDSNEDILGIGLALGRAIKQGAIRAGDEKKYYAFHGTTSGGADQKLDADVVSLGVDAGVDHIRNLRLILRGFLQGAYDYSPQDAALLAEFVTVYNAVYRGDWNYFAGRYRPMVLGGLTQKKAGLSVRFDEWPGQAQIIIPLTQVVTPGSLSAVDTSSVSDKNVVAQMRKEEDKGIDSRKDMVDLKERESAAAKQQAQLEREGIVDEEKKIAAEKAAIQAEKDRIAAEEKKTAAAPPAPTTTGTGSTAPAGTPGASQTQTPPAAAAGQQPQSSGETSPAKAAEQQQASEALAQDKAAVAQREVALAEREKKVEERKDQAAAKETFAEKKDAEASADRTQIAADQQQKIAQEAAAPAVPPSGELALRLGPGDSPYGRFVIVDPATGAELKASPLDTVHARAIAEVGGKLYAVAGKQGGNGAVRLVIVDKTTLEMQKQGDVDIQKDSPIWVLGDQLYALIVSGGGVRLGRFDTNLGLTATSSVPVHPYAAPTFLKGTVLIQGTDGAVVILKAADLSK